MLKDGEEDQRSRPLPLGPEGTITKDVVLLIRASRKEEKEAGPTEE